ncbi:UDP-N-acetylglucosamine:LPS N-acetylglucosamine transferase [Neolewinella xylanilytica]|uniref:UDP-N-acetylglucosamine:LPS N-acetylglucosamine transferase n=1 Tax=Neolewinella xylanilytica TaxID=1514080 RepID=A0A2S6I276_9BACT|nr:glycosyltransferase [Neolewinella xylanilytica]PPK85253.1 UDP-N-acetylglucosamine:LPS N-acetylglucosamine transferase [Neolewinella xylanilytica]
MRDLDARSEHTLICCLDWGLGHAARSLALARQLQHGGLRISWASSGPAAEMLRRELPDTEIHELPPYRVRYDTKSMVWNVARQAYFWRKTIKAEHRATAELVKKLGIDRIISDSRFGCYHAEVHSVFLTHQLHPITHFAPATTVYRWQLGRFDEFWVPDHPGHDRLSGKLSDPAGYENVQFIGPLPHIMPREGQPEYDLLALLSGPEPMRSRLEEIVVPQLESLAQSTHIVRGLPATAQSLHTSLDYTNFTDTATLSPLLTAARFVIARPGYSTLMDLRALNKKAILIPTPGQTEQMYLAQRAQLQGWAVAVMDQDKLDVEKALKRLMQSG